MVPSLLSLLHLHYRFRSFTRSNHPHQTTGTQVSDSHRALVSYSRAARSLAYFFLNLPLDRISWAISYLPGGLANSLVISRIRSNTQALDSVAARFQLLQPSVMGRVRPQPQESGAASSSTPAAAPAASAPLRNPRTKKRQLALGEWQRLLWLPVHRRVSLPLDHFHSDRFGNRWPRDPTEPSISAIHEFSIAAELPRELLLCAETLRMLIR